jgi:hypothetical protein
MSQRSWALIDPGPESMLGKTELPYFSRAARNVVQYIKTAPNVLVSSLIYQETLFQYVKQPLRAG